MLGTIWALMLIEKLNLPGVMKLRGERRTLASTSILRTLYDVTFMKCSSSLICPCTPSYTPPTYLWSRSSQLPRHRLNS